MSDHYAEAIKAPDVTIAGVDPSVAATKIQLSGLYGEIKGTFRQAFLDLTAPARIAKGVHRYRSDLRGNGTPRKRGKGKR